MCGRTAARAVALGLVSLVLTLAGGSVLAGKKNDTLVWLHEAESPTYDFYAQQQRIGVIVARHVWDTLVDQDPATGEVRPHLAESIGFSNPTTIDMKVRRGIDLYAGRDRQLVEAIMGDLAKIGIRVRLQWMQAAPLVDKARKGEVPMHFGTWGSGSVNDVSASTARFFDQGPDDFTRDARVTELIKKAGAELDPQKRLAFYEEAHQLIAKNAYWLPLWSDAYFYAMTTDLQFQPTPDEIPHFTHELEVTTQPSKSTEKDARTGSGPDGTAQRIPPLEWHDQWEE